MKVARHLDRAGLRARLILMLAAMVIASVTVLGLAAIAAFDRAIGPELHNRTRLIGSIVRAEIQRALELNIPINAVGGLTEYLETTLEKFAEVDRITIASTEGQAIARATRKNAPAPAAESALGETFTVHATNFVLPVLDGNRLVAEIRIEISPLFVETQLRDVFLDVMVLALIATLVALELAMVVTISSVGKPLDRVLRLLQDQSVGDFRHRIRQGGLSGLGRAAARLNDHAEDLAERLAALPASLRARVDVIIADGRPQRLRLSDFNDVRLALFLFSVAVEIVTAFLPLYARAAERPDWLNPNIAAAAPLVVYMAAVAALAPFGGRMAKILGARRLFLVSMPPSALALAAMGFTEGLIGITIWRGITAIFYATATIACQEYIIRATGRQTTAHAFSAFIAVIYGGVFVGSSLGGLLAGRFGFEAAFIMGGAFALLAGAQGAAAMRGRAGDADAPTPATPHLTAGPSDHRRLDSRLLALSLGVAVPMTAATSVFAWYLTPLMLAAAGSGPAEVGRVVMLYPLALVLFAPSAARMADGRVGPVLPLVIGAIGSGMAMLSLALWSGFWAVAVGVASLGLAHSLVRAPLYARALQLSGGPGPGMDALRVLERLGAIFGLAACALLLDILGAAASVQLVGLIALAGGLAYGLFEFAKRERAAD